jgi:signal transduction histidine kinase
MAPTHRQPQPQGQGRPPNLFSLPVPNNVGTAPYNHGVASYPIAELAVESGRSRAILPSLRLDELLAELQVRLEAVLATRDRVNALFEAVITVGASLDLEVALRDIVEAAVRLVDAKYGAMGVIGEGGRLVEFIPVGVTDEEISRIHHWPEGKGLLGALITDPKSMRIADLGAHALSSGFPRGHPPMTSFLGAPIRIRDEVYGNLYLTEKRDGRQFDEEDEAVLAALAAAAGVAIDNARLYDEARRQQRWLAASAEVTRILLSGADISDALELVTAKSLEISGADLVALALPMSEGRQLQIEHAAGDGAAGALGLVLPTGGSASGLVLSSGEQLSVDDFSGDQRVAQVAREHMSLGPTVLVPLGGPGNVRGVLTAGRRPGAMPLAPAAVDVLVLFASQAGIALELAEHRRQAEQVAVFEDRDRIARDLHDLVIQRLYATGMSLQGSTSLITSPEVAQRVSTAVDALDDTIKEIRTSIFALQARQDEKPPGLRARILQVADEMAGVLGFPPGLILEGLLDDVPQDVGEHLLSVLREALSNAARHSGASRVDVRVRAAGDLSLIVLDNGSGIKDTGRRSGLANLDQRALNLGGSFRVAPAEGGGTELDWRVPLAVPRVPTQAVDSPAN